jgi:hypothetical protein
MSQDQAKTKDTLKHIPLVRWKLWKCKRESCIATFRKMKSPKVSHNFGTKFGGSKLVPIRLSLESWFFFQEYNTLVKLYWKKMIYNGNYGHENCHKLNYQNYFWPLFWQFRRSNHVIFLEVFSSWTKVTH